jgi:hypothetical protein
MGIFPTMKLSSLLETNYYNFFLSGDLITRNSIIKVDKENGRNLNPNPLHIYNIISQLSELSSQNKLLLIKVILTIVQLFIRGIIELSFEIKL